MRKIRGVTFNLPWPPSVNHMHISTGKARFRSKAYVAFCGLVANIVEREKIPANGSKRLTIAIWLHAPNRRKVDVDNRAKPVLDALQRAGVFDDDEQVDELHIYRSDIAKLGYCTVNISEA
jgi:crossover junction endodeoxyribonuclease RusA